MHVLDIELCLSGLLSYPRRFTGGGMEFLRLFQPVCLVSSWKQDESEPTKKYHGAHFGNRTSRRFQNKGEEAMVFYEV